MPISIYMRVEKSAERAGSRRGGRVGGGGKAPWQKFVQDCRDEYL